ncbi:TPA: ash family protein [Salmonella enterica subsp. diarizonae]|nr:ash family protein [Salmonella enterica subsp. diarizonae]
MTTHKNRLPVSLLVGYIRPAPHKAGAGFRSLLTVKAHNRASGFFTCKASSRLFRIMAGRTGEPQGSPGSLTAGTANLVRLATPCFAALGGELSLPVKGAILWQTANTPALTLSVSTPSQKLIAVSTAPAHWRHTSQFALIVCQRIRHCTGCHPSWTTLLTICWRYSSLLTPWNGRTKNTHLLKYCLHSARWRGVCLSGIQEAL